MVLTALLHLPAAYAEPSSPLVRLARPGVWPAVSDLTVYDGRIWLTNSQPYEDNNAADIYSYDPATADLRFERGLFSQDVGEPAVVDGRLFLPFEDPRFNLSLGEYAVTDGSSWRWRRLPEGTAFHTHAMGACGNDLLAVTGAWEGQLHVSSDRGRSWKLEAIYPARRANFSRLIAIKSWHGRCFVGGFAWGRLDGKLLEWRNGRLAPVAGWPAGGKTDHLTVWQDQLLAMNHTNSGVRLHAFNGKAVRSLASPSSGRLHDLAADGAALWAVVGEGRGGSLWRTLDGIVWEQVQLFDETPIAVTAVEGDVFVGTHAAGGGSFWGPRGTDGIRHAAPAKPFEPRKIERVPPASFAVLDAAIDAYLEQRIGGQAGIDAISDALRPLAAFDDPAIGNHLSQRLAALDIRHRVRFFSRDRTRRAHRLGWYLLSAIAIDGHGRIPPELLSVPLSTSRNQTRKNLDTPIAAIATVGWLAQNDPAIIAALMERLDAADGEAWLSSDIIAALSALTGQQPGHDSRRWQAWWRETRRH